MKTNAYATASLHLCSAHGGVRSKTSTQQRLLLYERSMFFGNRVSGREVNISTAVFMLDPISTPLVFVKHHNFIYIPPILVFPLDVELKNGRK